MNQEQYEMLKRSVDEWNEWRSNNAESAIDLARYDFCGADLRNANLCNANLHNANLSAADLTSARLTFANLSTAQVPEAKLRGADLRHVDFRSTYLRDADLRGANLGGANFHSTNLHGANLSGTVLTSTAFMSCWVEATDFEAATFAETSFSNVALSQALNLDKVIHKGRSTLGTDTLSISPTLPINFLRGCGLPDDIIRYLPSLFNNAMDFYSCFISYSHADTTFATRLENALQGRGIRCWLDEHQLLPGDPIGAGIDEGIKIYDKVLLCCSEHSLKAGPGWWVDKEITKAMRKEEFLSRQRGKRVFTLIPLNLDDYVTSADHPWASEFRARIMPDFTDWDTDNAKFEAQLEPLIRALRADAGARLPHPEPKL